MATWIAEYITQRLLTLSVIEEGDRELYKYGFFLVTTHFYFFLVTVIAGFLVGVPCESILFYIIFMLLRTYAGGVHARTETVCTILTTFALTVSVFEIKLMAMTNSNIISVSMLAGGSLCIFLLSPLDTGEKPLDNREKQRYRMICYILIFLCIIISKIAQIWSLDTVYYSVACGVCLEGILLSIGKCTPSRR